MSVTEKHESSFPSDQPVTAAVDWSDWLNDTAREYENGIYRRHVIDSVNRRNA